MSSDRCSEFLSLNDDETKASTHLYIDAAATSLIERDLFPGCRVIGPSAPSSSATGDTSLSTEHRRRGRDDTIESSPTPGSCVCI